MQVFMVGCGALGCEYMKALALMGVGTSGRGKVVVTDMDTIEVTITAEPLHFDSLFRWPYHSSSLQFAFLQHVYVTAQIIWA